jgi:signal transduction histidine kinase
MMRGDATGLEQMIGNLVSNAIRYTPRGGNVSLRLTKTNAALRLEVEDTGMGIPREDLGKIFDEFYRAANAREKVSDGSGLGLTIVKAVAEQHQGSVSVESTVGKGTRFTVDLPLAPAGGDEYA